MSARLCVRACVSVCVCVRVSVSASVSLEVPFFMGNPGHFCVLWTLAKWDRFKFSIFIVRTMLPVFLKHYRGSVALLDVDAKIWGSAAHFSDSLRGLFQLLHVVSFKCCRFNRKFGLQFRKNSCPLMIQEMEMLPHAYHQFKKTYCMIQLKKRGALYLLSPCTYFPSFHIQE